MATIVQVDGLSTISVGSGTSGALETLGYSQDGVIITENLRTLEVHGDANGGMDGDPIDIQHLTEHHIVRMLLTKYDEAVLNKLRSRLNNGIAFGNQGGYGWPPGAGLLLFAGGFYFRLLINNPTNPRNYLCCVFREPHEFNKGTKHSQAMLVGTCYSFPVTGASFNRLYDRTIS